MVELTSTKMERASEMRKQGKSYRIIAEKLKIPCEAVRQRLLTASKRGDLYPRSPPERPPMSAISQRHILPGQVRNPCRSSHHVGLDHGVSATTTVSNVANTHCLYRFVSELKPLLTTRARLDKIKWASEVANQDWTSVIFTDESLVKIGAREGGKFNCCRFPGLLADQ